MNDLHLAKTLNGEINKNLSTAFAAIVYFV